MTDKELKKLTRVELLEMLIQQSKTIEKMQTQLDSAEEQLKNKEIKIETAGSLAEVSAELNKLFEAADATAKQYLDNVERLGKQPSEDGGTASEAQRIIDEAKAKADRIIAQAKAEAESIVENAKSAKHMRHSADKGHK